MLVPVLAGLVGLRRRAGAATLGRSTVTAPLELVERGLEALRRGGTQARPAAEAAVDAALAEQLPEEQRAPVRSLLLAHRAAWRVTLVEPDGSDQPPAVKGLAVIDAGTDGLWLRTSPAEPITGPLAPDTPLVLEPADPGSVWAALVDLLDDDDHDGEDQEVA